MAYKRSGGGKKIVLGILAAALISISSFAYSGQDQLFASAVRAATTQTADQVKTNYRGVYIFAKVTDVPGVKTLTFTIQGKDYDGDYYDIISSTASAATGTVTLKVYPGMAAAANSAASEALPDVWRVKVTYSAGGNFTYSIVANTLQ